MPGLHFSRFGWYPSALVAGGVFSRLNGQFPGPEWPTESGWGQRPIPSRSWRTAVGRRRQ